MSSNTPVFLLKDENGNRGYPWMPRATETLYGVIKPDGTTITAQDGVLSAANAGANTDLSNLTSNGNAKFQYAPFSINSGSVDASGNNNTLTAGGSTPQTVEVDVIPVLSSNNSSYGTCNDYTMTQTKGNSWANMTNPFIMDLASNNYIPAGAVVTMTIKTNNAERQISVTGNLYYEECGCQGARVIYTYTDDTAETVLNESNAAFASWKTVGAKTASIVLPSPSKTVKKITVQGIGYYRDTGSTPVYDAYYNAWGINFKAKYTIASASDIICAPCTITTADSRSKTFTASNILNVSSIPDGTYKVLKSYLDNSLSLAPSLFIQKKEPAEISWTQPVLTADGTLGGSSPAAAASGITGNLNAYHAFDGLDASSPGWAYSASAPQWILFYNPEAFILQSFDVINRYHAWRAFKLQGSNDGSTYEDIQEYTNSDTAKDSLWTKTVNTANQRAYKYYRFYITQAGQYVDAEQIKLYGVLLKPPVNGDVWIDISKYPLTLKQYTQPNYTVNGSPAITSDGIASGFSGVNYIKKENISISANETFTIQGKITTGADTVSNQAYLGINQRGSNYILLENRITNNALIFIYAAGAETNQSFSIPCTPNTEYSYIISYDGASLVYTINGTARNPIQNFYSADFGDVCFGRSREGATSGYEIPFNGSIDLKEFKIYAAGNLVYQPNIPNGWVINNDLVYIGDASIASGVVTAVSNNPYNWNGVTGSSAAMPSNRVINLTLGASGSTYTAPADGWFSFYAAKSTAGYTYLRNNTIGFQIESRTTVNDTGCGCYLPVKKGDVVTINYDGVNSNTLWRFYYAQGN